MALHLRKDRLSHVLHALAQLDETVRIGLEMMNELLAMQEFRHDESQSSGERVTVNALKEALLHRASPLLQEGTDGLAVTVLDGHGDQVRGPVRLGPPRLEHRLHPDIDNAALERLYQIVQVIDFPLREDDEHLPSPLHHLDGVALGLLVLTSALHGKSAQALEPPAGDTAAFVERLSIHHEEEPAVAAAGEFQASLEIRLISVVGG